MTEPPQSSDPVRADPSIAAAPALGNQTVIVILIILLALLAIFAGNTALTLADFKRTAAAQAVETKRDIQRQAELQRLDAAEIKTQLMNIAISAKASEVRLDAITVYYDRASARLASGKR